MMRYNLTRSIFFISLFFFACFFFTSTTFSQISGANIDHLPQRVVEEWVPQSGVFSPVTINGWDNYFLGTDDAEPHMSENPNDPLQYFNAFNINQAHRTFNGFDWIYSVPSFGTDGGDPVTAYDSLGNLYYMQLNGSYSASIVIRSTNNGQTWGTPVTAIQGGDKCWIAADQTSGPYANYVYATMTNNSFSGHGFARSTNFGASFTPTFTASNSPLPGAMVAVGPYKQGATDIPGGCVYFVTNSGSAFASTYTFYRSTDGGATFQLMSAQNFSNYVGSDINGRNSVQNMRTRPYPFITADNSYGSYRGMLYLVYASNNPSGNGNKPDIFCRYSNDQGVTWSSAVTVNDDANSQNNNQWHPSTWCDKETGRLYIKWMDTRDTPTSDSAYIYASYSDDGGQTFAANQRISNQKMKINCSTCGGSGTPRYQGDYDAIASNGDVSLSVWTDFRNGSFGSYVGYFPDFALLVTPASNTVYNDADSVFYTIDIPATTLYTNDAIFSATVSPTPSQGTIDVSFEPSNIISTFPGQTQLKIKTSGFVTVGTYQIDIDGQGPNGTPIHKRQVDLVVQEVVPVELNAFNAHVQKDGVLLNWQTVTETNNKGFQIERSISHNSQAGEWNSVDFIPGHINSTEIINYSYMDKNISRVGQYSYRLKQYDLNGSYHYSNVSVVNINRPLNFELSQNYPNPFNPSTKIEFSIPDNEFVTIKVYDVLGNEVKTLINEKKAAGSYEVNFSADNLSSGVYYYKIQAGNFVKTNKMMLLK